MNCAILATSVPTAVASRSSSFINRRTSTPPTSASAPILGGGDSPPLLSSPLHPLPSWRQPRSAHLVRANLSPDGEEEKVAASKGPFQVIKQTTPDGEAVADDPTSASTWVIKLEQSINSLLIALVINLLEVLYRDRPYARFYVLETIARVPYFAFTSVLHLYETCGWWRSPDYLKVHFAETWNELHHLLIMEELGGGDVFFDRFLARTVAVVYYFLTVLMYFVSPRMAYNLSECVERHAYASYDGFLRLHEEVLKGMPAPEIAVRYYTGAGGGDLYMFDEFQTSRAPGTRRPRIENLYDVFVNIRDDEAEHCETMRACQQARGTLRSPHSGKQEFAEDGALGGPDYVPPLSSQGSHREESLLEGGHKSRVSLPDRNN